MSDHACSNAKMPKYQWRSKKKGLKQKAGIQAIIWQHNMPCLVEHFKKCFTFQYQCFIEKNSLIFSIFDVLKLYQLQPAQLALPTFCRVLWSVAHAENFHGGSFRGVWCQLYLVCVFCDVIL